MMRCIQSLRIVLRMQLLYVCLSCSLCLRAQTSDVCMQGIQTLAAELAQYAMTPATSTLTR